jgi:hypothetical protein
MPASADAKRDRDVSKSTEDSTAARLLAGRLRNDHA